MLVYVMLSGGVDSSVAAAILKEKGYQVKAIFMKCWSQKQLTALGADQSLYACHWEDDVSDAELVAQKLDIPFEVWDFEEEYRQKVVEYMLREYRLGRTPNPDVMCNSTIKFGIFYQKAMQEGADFVATGHYARIISEDFEENDRFLAKAQDELKEQSYFLWKIKKEQLNKILLPIGEFVSKQDVREYAEKMGLITASKKDSQGLCFIGQTPLRELLLQTIGQKDGEIIDENGQVLGSHPGAFLYTIGQREKLGLSGGPWFVSKIDIEKNQVIVAHISQIQSLFSASLVAKDANWLVSSKYLASLKLENENSIELEIGCTCQTRYHQSLQQCTVKILSSNEVLVSFAELVRAISKGQSIVFYNKQILLGGAVIS